MTTPCSVNMRLYVIASMMVGPGVSSSMPDQQREDAAQQEREQHRTRYMIADPLVIDASAATTMTPSVGVQVVAPRGDRSAHRRWLVWLGS